MKFMAIGNVVKPLTDEQKGEILPKEVPATLQLYLDGIIEQFWFRQDPGKVGVVFLLNAESLEHAKEKVDSLPLTAAKFMTFDLIQVGPLAPLGMLIQAK